MERNLVSPCDVSPIQPKQLREAENLKPGLDMEKLLLERVMLRKELKLRSMQEKLLDQTQKLEEAEEKLAEYESLPGFSQFQAVSKKASIIAQRGEILASRLRRGAAGSGTGVYMVRLLFLEFYMYCFSFQIISFIIFSLPSHLLHLLPSTIQLGCASLVQHVASWVGETAQNYNNECRERKEREQKEEKVLRRGERRRRSRT